MSSFNSDQLISVAAYDLTEDAIGSDKQISMQNTFNKPLSFSWFFGTRNDQEMTNYQIITNQVNQESS